MEVLRVYIQGDMEVTEYTKDRETVAYSISKNINLEPIVSIEDTEPSIEERIEQIEMTSAYTQLQVDYVAFLTEILATPQ